MIREIAIYVEGGGSTGQTLIPFRTGMLAFLKPFMDEVRRRRIRCNVVACGGRQEAYDAFVNKLRREPEVYSVLLVDAEEPVAKDASPWTHLAGRKGDHWACPEGADDARCHLMVVTMEAWFLADPDTLKDHFGGNFDEKKLPPANQAETRPKHVIEDALRQATRNTKAGEYKKIRDGAKLLEKIDPAVVRKHCKWCDRLFTGLGEAIGAKL